MSDSDSKEFKFRGFDLNQIRDEAKRLQSLYEHQQKKYRHDHDDTQYGTMRVPVKLLIDLIDVQEEVRKRVAKAQKVLNHATDLEEAARKSRLMRKRYGLHGQECSVDATAKRTVKHHEGDMVFELPVDAHPTWDDTYASDKNLQIDTSDWDKPIPPNVSVKDFLNLVQIDLPEGEDAGSISKERLAELINAKLTEDGIAIPKQHVSGHPYSEYLDEHGFFKIDIEPEFSKGTWEDSIKSEMTRSLGLPPPVVGSEGINLLHRSIAGAQEFRTGHSLGCLVEGDKCVDCAFHDEDPSDDSST